MTIGHPIQLICTIIDLLLYRVLNHSPNTLFKNGVLVNSYNVTPSQSVPSIKMRDKKATFGSQLIVSSYVVLFSCGNVIEL